MNIDNFSVRSGRFIKESGGRANIANTLAPEPNGGEELTVSGAGVVALTVPDDTISAIITNPVAVRIAFGTTASETVGTYFPAYSCPSLGSAEQVAQASVYWTDACSGAYAQYFK